MIYHNVAQNSEAWDRLRLGIPTSSEFHRIMCSELGKRYKCSECGAEFDNARKTCAACKGACDVIAVGRKSTQYKGYMHRLLAEWIYDAPLEDPESTLRSPWMERGHQLEQEAVSAYELDKNCDTQPGGFVTTDNGMVGCSPDRLVGENGLLEIKCPSPPVHVGYMVERSVDGAYWPQLQGQLLITGRTHVDIVSYCPCFPSVIIRVPRDEQYIGFLQDVLVEFVREMMGKRKFLELNYPIREVPKPQAVADDPLGVSDADVDAILAAREVQP